MESFIEYEALAGLRKGSMESFTEYLSAAATKKLGEDVAVIATHRDHAFGVAGDRVVKITWKRTEEGTKISVKGSKVPVITEETVDTFAAKRLAETVDSIMDGDLEGSRTRLRGLAHYVQSGGRYWASDGAKSIAGVTEEVSPWLAQYESNRKAIRKAVHGVLGETEAKVPRTPYARIPSDRISEFDVEIRESLAAIGKLIDEMPDLSSLAFTEEESEGVELASARDALVSESAILKEAVGQILRFLRPTDLLLAAKCHDILAERLKPMLVVGKFLARLSEQQSSGDNHASSP